MWLYPDFARFVADGCQQLDEFEKAQDDQTDYYLGAVEVYLEGDVCGYLINEGGYCYVDANTYNKVIKEARAAAPEQVVGG